MIACPLCEALFTRYEFALDEGYSQLIPLLRRALRKHGRQGHDLKTVLDISMYFTSIDLYRQWVSPWLAAPAGDAGEEGRR